jgi:type I restriction enzyme S subunit
VESGTGKLLFQETASAQGAESGKYLCRKGDVIYSKIRPALRKLTFAPDGCLCSADMYPLRPYGRILNSYLYWILLSDSFSAWSVLESDRVAMPKINRDTLSGLQLPVPSPSEQNTIATFLETELAKLDSLLEKKRIVIEKLKEKRGALISLTVTKGLPPDVVEEYAAKFPGLNVKALVKRKLRASGIDDIGDVPTDWVTKQLKHVSQLYGRIGFRGYTTEDLVDEAEGAITLSPSNMIEGNLNLSKCSFISWEKYYESPEIMVGPHDILIVKTGSTFGKVAYVSSAPHPMTINPQIAVFKNITCDSRFLFYYVSSSYIQGLIRVSNTGSTIPTMTEATIMGFAISLPPIQEQVAIAAFLDLETSKIDRMIEKVEAAIAKLSEYRTALITAAVTGKIDVRGFKP